MSVLNRTEVFSGGGQDQKSLLPHSDTDTDHTLAFSMPDLSSGVASSPVALAAPSPATTDVLYLFPGLPRHHQVEIGDGSRSASDYPLGPPDSGAGVTFAAEWASINFPSDNVVQSVVSASEPPQLYLTEPGDTSAISITDVHQGGIGDCFLLAAMGELACWSPSTIQRMIEDNDNGTYTVTLYENSNGSLINLGSDASASSFKVVQETVGTNFASNGANSAGQDVVNGQNEIWVQVLEEAVAQLYAPAGSQTSAGYSVLNNGGFPNAAMEVLTGRVATATTGANQTSALLLAYQAIGALVVFGTSPTGSTSLNLIGDHAYAFESVTMQGGNAMVQLYNPWGTDQPALMTLSALVFTSALRKAYPWLHQA
jgi:Calpain family cysteine protease